MTFKEAMERYRAGTASAEEKQLVEAELEKHSLIAEYLDEQWDETAALVSPPAEEMQRVRKSLRRRNSLVVITSIVLAAALLLAVVLVGIPAAERLYWDPTQPSGVQPDSTDLELMLAAYTELFCPEVNVAGVSANRIGFARYDVSLRSVVQAGTRERSAVNLTFVTHTALEKNIRAALADLAAKEDMLLAEPTVIRVED